MVLARGKMYIAFVANEAEIDKVQTEVSTAFTEAVAQGYFPFPDIVPINVGTDALPTHVPTRNVHPSTDTETVTLAESDETGSAAEHHRAVAAKTAAKVVSRSSWALSATIPNVGSVV